MIATVITSDLMLQAVEASNDGIVITDLQRDGQPIVYANPAFEAMTGYTQADIIGRNCRFLQGDDTQSSAIGALRTAISHNNSCEVTLRNYKKNGELFYNRLSISPVNTCNGVTRYYIGVQKDVTHEIMLTKNLKRANNLYSQINESLSNEAQVDLLTGLKNQRYLDDVGNLLFTNAQREGLPVNLYLVGIDGFRQLNKLRGQSVADNCLQVYADKIVNIFNCDSDICSRLQTDRFLIFTLCRSEAEHLDQAKRLQQSLSSITLFFQTERQAYQCFRHCRDGSLNPRQLR
jgi:PAS domain S-box-containing protein/diguanylate cyclase (GGDEF)-like protein